MVTPLVFLPGAGGRTSFWRPVAGLLADLGPVQVLGYPGFGDVPVRPDVRSLDDLQAWLLDQLAPGPSHLIAQSMGGLLAARLAIEHPDRVARLVLVATSGGVDVEAHGAAPWRGEYVAELPDLPRWFVDDRTDLGARLGAIRAPTLLLWSDADPISPVAVMDHLARLIPGAQRATIHGGTHAFAIERPAEVAAAIRAHLSETSRRRQA